MLLRDVLLMAGIDVALGIAGSLATARLAEATVSGLLFGLKTNDAIRQPAFVFRNTRSDAADRMHR